MTAVRRTISIAAWVAVMSLMPLGGVTANQYVPVATDVSRISPV
jgi:hypothetical protein